MFSHPILRVGNGENKIIVPNKINKKNRSSSISNDFFDKNKV